MGYIRYSIRGENIKRFFFFFFFLFLIYGNCGILSDVISKLMHVSLKRKLYSNLAYYKQANFILTQSKNIVCHVRNKLPIYSLLAQLVNHYILRGIQSYFLKFDTRQEMCNTKTVLNTIIMPEQYL